jgi:hypothetical protein
LCVGESGNETCLTKQQIDNLMQNNNVPSQVIISPVPATNPGIPGDTTTVPDNSNSGDQTDSVTDTDTVITSNANSGDSSPDAPNSTISDTLNPTVTE